MEKAISQPITTIFSSQNIVTSALLMGTAFLAGSKRYIKYFPDTSQKNFFISASISSLSIFGSNLMFTKNNRQERQRKIISILVGIVFSNIFCHQLYKNGFNNRTLVYLIGFQASCCLAIDIFFIKLKFSSSSRNTHVEKLPTSLYEFSNDDILQLTYWKNNKLEKDGLPCPKTPSHSVHIHPIAASPQHGDYPFSQPGTEAQYIILKERNVVISMRFQAPNQVMKPNIDTILLCHGINKILPELIQRFNAIDVGSGSGFVAKYIATANPSSSVYAVDINSDAIRFMHKSDMPKNVQIINDDAMKMTNLKVYDLVVSNPPYVPTEEETQKLIVISETDPNFWKGTGLMCHLIQKSNDTFGKNQRLVILVSSLALKSLRLLDVIDKKTNNLKAKILYESEVAYKAWFAGDSRVEHLLASKEEEKETIYFKGLNLNLFVGATKPGEPRKCLSEDGRRKFQGYYWQFIYIIEFSKKN